RYCRETKKVVTLQRIVITEGEQPMRHTRNIVMLRSERPGLSQRSEAVNQRPTGERSGVCASLRRVMHAFTGRKKQLQYN
ncbi:MAG: hypothetical protein K2H47_10625, partial [Muribaculaceae bacterium]|nr:hypothetical protein [Muribaculaceae bacterium]